MMWSATVAWKNQLQIVLRRFKGDRNIYQSAGNNNYSSVLMIYEHRTCLCLALSWTMLCSYRRHRQGTGRTYHIVLTGVKLVLQSTAVLTWQPLAFISMTISTKVLILILLTVQF